MRSPASWLAPACSAAPLSRSCTRVPGCAATALPCPILVEHSATSPSRVRCCLVRGGSPRARSGSPLCWSYRPWPRSPSGPTGNLRCACCTRWAGYAKPPPRADEQHRQRNRRGCPSRTSNIPGRPGRPGRWPTFSHRGQLAHHRRRGETASVGFTVHAAVAELVKLLAAAAGTRVLQPLRSGDPTSWLSTLWG